MICRTYKNGNITIKHEAWYDGDLCTDFHIFPLWITEHEDGFNVDSVGDFECWGNSYGAYPLHICVNGELGIYYVTPHDFEAFGTGHTVRLRRDGLVPLFTLPEYCNFRSYRDERTNTRGILYTLCETPSDHVRNVLELCGCTWHVVVPEYAPEMRRHAVFVPDGTPFDFS